MGKVWLGLSVLVRLGITETIGVIVKIAKIPKKFQNSGFGART